MRKKYVFKATVHYGDWDGESYFCIEKEKSDHTYGFFHPYHYHPWNELYFLIEGNCTFSVKKVKYELNSGDCIFIPRYTEHKVVYNTSPHERYLLEFTQDFFPFSLLEKKSLFSPSPVFSSNEEEKNNIMNILSKLLKEYVSPDEYSDELRKKLIFELLLYFVRNPVKESGYGSNNLDMEYILEYIQKNFYRKITLQELADIDYANYSYMSHSFKKYTGMTVGQYITKVRIDNAKKLLVETDYSISDISEKCGFNDSNHFSYVFKNEEKISPSKFRRQYSHCKDDKNI